MPPQRRPCFCAQQQISMAGIEYGIRSVGIRKVLTPNFRPYAQRMSPPDHTDVHLDVIVLRPITNLNRGVVKRTTIIFTASDLLLPIRSSLGNTEGPCNEAFPAWPREARHPVGCNSHGLFGPVSWPHKRTLHSATPNLLQYFLLHRLPVRVQTGVLQSLLNVLTIELPERFNGNGVCICVV